MDKRDLASRDMEIHAKVSGGLPLRKVAKQHGITESRVRQIIANGLPKATDQETPVHHEPAADFSRPRPNLLERLDLLENRVGYLCDMLGLQLPS